MDETNSGLNETPCSEASDAQTPLVVDLDGTLLKTDLLLESFCRVLATRPQRLVLLPKWLSQGKAQLKARIADDAIVDFETLPVNTKVLEFIRQERAKGRRIFVASASDQRLVQEVADHLGPFDGIFASDGRVNLSGKAKADRLMQEFGERGFDYVGNADADLDIWKHANKAITANCSRKLSETVAQHCSNHMNLSTRDPAIQNYLESLRVHQWAKNILLFAPMFAAHAVTPSNIGILLLAFLSFSLTASAVYLVNDLVDLPSDRDHTIKRSRPFARGAVPLLHGAVMVSVLLLIGVALAALVSWLFLAAIAFYLLLTTSYTFYLKQKAIVDVIALAGLYTLRVIAGGAALMVPLSVWFLAFSMFLFLSLALVKRCAELKARMEVGRGEPIGRGYHLDDMPLLLSLGGGAGYAAVVILALYINSPKMASLYAYPEGLWLICVLLIYWISRMLLLTHRGTMHEDPIVFALRDRVSLFTVAITVLIIAASSL